MPRYAIDAAAVTRLRIFVDVGLVEVYVDGGRWCATKRIDSAEPFASVRLHGDARALKTARAWALRRARGLPVAAM
jgi:beta-fructofuranosidase